MGARRGVAVMAMLGWAILGGCGAGDDGGWAGEITDSAGVALVRNAGAGVWGDDGWLVEEMRALGDAGAPIAFGHVADATIRADTLFVLDQLAQRIHVFGPDGTLLRDIGAPGDGPGELSRFAGSIVLLADTMLVADWGRGRLHRFSAAGTFLDASLLVGGGARSWWRMGGDGRVHARSMRRYVDDAGAWAGEDVLLRLRDLGPEDAEGEGGAPSDRAPANGDASPAGVLAVDTVLTFDYPETDIGGRGNPRLPLLVNVPTWDVRSDGAVVWASLDQSVVRVVAPDGSLERRVTSDDWVRRGPSPDEEAALLELMGDKLVSLGGSRETVETLTVDQPESFPAFTAVRLGPEGTLWVQRMGAAQDVDPMALNTPDPPTGWGGGVWDVLDRDGRLLGSVDLGSRVRLLRLTDDRVVGVRRDAVGLESVVVWRIVR